MCVWQPIPKTADVTVTETAGSRPHAHESVFFFVFLAFIVVYATATLLNTLYINLQAIRSIGQCDVNIPSLSPPGSLSKAVAND